jgi:hypothetical protein
MSFTLMIPFMSGNRGRINFFLLHCAFVAGSLLSTSIGCGTACGAEVKLVPSCEVKEEFNDNVFLTANDRKSDFITTLAPSLAYSRATERLSFNLLTGVSRHEYSRSEGIGKLDYQYNAQMAYRLTTQEDIGLGATYMRNSRPDSIIKTTGLATGTAKDNYQYSVNLRKLIDETTAASLTYSFVQDTYDNPAYQASDVHNAGLIVSKDLGAIQPLLKGTFSTNFSRAIYRDSESDNYALRIGASRNFNERLNVNLSIGGQFINSTFVTTSGRNNESWGAVGAVNLTYTGEKTSGSFSIARNFSAASGLVAAVETTSFGLIMGHSLTDKSTVQVTAAYNINQTSSGQYSLQSADFRVLNLKADIVYKMSKMWDLGLQYAHYTVNYGFNDNQVTQNSVMLRAVVKNPITW